MIHGRVLARIRVVPMDDAVYIAMNPTLCCDESFSTPRRSERDQVRRRIDVVYDGAILAKCQSYIDVAQP